VNLRRLRSLAARAVGRRPAPDRHPPTAWNVISPQAGHSWSGRTVVVTGAAGLLGRATVEALVQRGAFVHAVDRDVAALAVLAEQHGDGVLVHAADIALQGPVDRLAESVSLQATSLDALIHCVGHKTYTSTGQPITADAWHRVLSDNLVAPALVTQALLPLLRQVPLAGVVMITSVNGRIASQWPDYAAAKAGLGKLTRDLAVQFAPLGVRVNAVAPGWFVSPETAAMNAGDTSAALTRSASPVDAVVNAVLFLADPALSPCTTGQEFAVDGGIELAEP